MSIPITFNGVSYDVPEFRDTNYANELTQFFVAIPNGTLQPTGGLFTLLADADFGASYGLKSLYVKSRGTNISSTGIFRMASAESIGWRNNANDGNLLLTTNASDELLYDGDQVLTGTGPGSYVSSITGTANQVVASASTGAITLSLPQSLATSSALQFGSLALGASLASSAILSLSSTTKGFLPPRLTTAERDAIASPGTGLFLYNTSTNVYNMYNGATWTAVEANSSAINTGAQYRLAYYATAGETLSALSAITATRALVSDANGLPTSSSVTTTELGYVSGVTSAIQTQINNATLYANVMAFGAVGNGIADDTTAIQNAIDSLSAGGIVFLPEGTYNFTGLNLPNYVSLIGAGSNSSILQFTPATGDGIVIHKGNTITDLQIYSPNHSTGWAIIGPAYPDYVSDFVIDRFSISAFKNGISILYGLQVKLGFGRMGGLGIATTGATGIKLGLNPSQVVNVSQFDGTYLNGYETGINATTTITSLKNVTIEDSSTAIVNQGRMFVTGCWVAFTTYAFETPAGGWPITATQNDFILDPSGEVDDLTGYVNLGTTSDLAAFNKTSLVSPGAWDMRFQTSAARGLKLGTSQNLSMYSASGSLTITSDITPLTLSKSSGTTLLNLAINSVTKKVLGINASDEYTVYAADGSTELQTTNEAGSVRQPRQPLFNVTNGTGAANVTGDGTDYTVLWPTEVADQQSNFTSNTFTAPVTGVYLLSTGVSLTDIAVTHTVRRLQIVTTGKTYSQTVNRLLAEAALGQNMTVLAPMTAGDTATVHVSVDASTKTVSVEANAGKNYFTGVLI